MSTEKVASKKVGRPLSSDKKDFMLRIRVDAQTLKLLDEICQKKNVSRSELIRSLIHNLK